MTDLQRARVIAARRELESREIERDHCWLAWMRAKPGEPQHDELIAVLHSLDARIARKQREIAELEGKRPRRFLEAVA